MRLLHSKALKFETFDSEADTPPYAILSHTWGQGEVLFQELENSDISSIPKNVKRKAGFAKIAACARQAAYDGFDYVWIDTCCINKSSSAELQEAINSMFKWYRNAFVCYAYLADVPSNASWGQQMEHFRHCKWFTRGWTLQELIAPARLEFYGAIWPSSSRGAFIGTKLSLRSEIFHITGIDEEALLGHPLSDYSVAQRMSWAAKRQTTREEDIAYCLIGLFDLNMPMLYGEGDKAFTRLQEEILRSIDDDSIFAWRKDIWLRRSLSDKKPAFQRFFADAPAAFANSGNIVPYKHIIRHEQFSVTSKGLVVFGKLEPIKFYLDDSCELYLFALNCRLEKLQTPVYILLAKVHDDCTYLYRRYGGGLVVDRDHYTCTGKALYERILIHNRETPRISNDRLPDVYSDLRPIRCRQIRLRQIPQPSRGFSVISFWSIAQECQQLPRNTSILFDQTKHVQLCQALEFSGKQQSRFSVFVGFVGNEPWIHVNCQWTKMLRALAYREFEFEESLPFKVSDRTIWKLSPKSSVKARISRESSARDSSSYDFLVDISVEGEEYNHEDSNSLAIVKQD